MLAAEETEKDLQAARTDLERVLSNLKEQNRDLTTEGDGLHKVLSDLIRNVRRSFQTLLVKPSPFMTSCVNKNGDSPSPPSKTIRAKLVARRSRCHNSKPLVQPPNYTIVRPAGGFICELTGLPFRPALHKARNNHGSLFLCGWFCSWCSVYLAIKPDSSTCFSTIRENSQGATGGGSEHGVRADWKTTFAG